MRFALPTFSVLMALGVGSAAAPAPPLRIPVDADARVRAPKTAEPVVVPCPLHTLPDGEVCVHIPTGDDIDSPESAVGENAHHTRGGRWQIYDDIPRRPDRPADYDLYKFPVPPGLPGNHSVISGYDLDKPDQAQRRGATLRAVGHGGVDLPQARGTPAHAVALEHQQGDADVLYMGPLFGTTVLTRNTVREGGKLREYVVLFGHLDSVAPGIAAGSVVKDGDVVGFVGDTGSPELVHLHWEARRVRDGVDVVRKAKQGGSAVLAEDVSIVCDPRNVLPLK